MTTHTQKETGTRVKTARLAPSACRDGGITNCDLLISIATKVVPLTEALLNTAVFDAR